jgi:hypothetical protein
VGFVVEKVAMGQVYFRIISPVLHPHIRIYFRRYITSATDKSLKEALLSKTGTPNQGVVIVIVPLTLLKTRGMEVI